MHSAPRVLASATLALLAGAALAQSSGGGYAITKQVIASGATNASGGGYALIGTVAQPQAGTQSGTGYALVGGFPPGDSAPPISGDPVFADGFE